MTSPSVKFFIWFDTIICTQKTINVTLWTRNDKVDLNSIEHTITQTQRNICMPISLSFCIHKYMYLHSYFKFHTRSNLMSGLSEKYRLLNTKKTTFKYHDHRKWLKKPGISIYAKSETQQHKHLHSLVKDYLYCTCTVFFADICYL